MSKKPYLSLLSLSLVASAFAMPLEAASLAGPQSFNQPSPGESKPADSEPSPKYKNLLTTLKGAFFSPNWNQGHLLNSTAYGSLLALSIDASANLGRPIVFDPDSTLEGPATVKEYIRGLNQWNYLEYWKKPYTPKTEKGHWYAFSQISLKQIPNNDSTKDAIKAAIDNNQAVVFTYNFIRDDCFSQDEFFRLKFNLPEGEVYKDDSSYDSLYDGEHTMCIVGYDDSDESFIVQDSRTSLKPFALPGLKYLENSQRGLIKTPQNLDYANFFYKSNKRSGTYRYEFFTLTADWVRNDLKPPVINSIKVDIAQSSGYSTPEGKYYNVSANITDDVKVTNRVSAEISIPDVGVVPQYSIFKDNAMTLIIPILDPGSMSAPITTTVKVTAYDTSGNEAINESQCHFPYGLPLSYFSKASDSNPVPAIPTQFNSLAATTPNYMTGPGVKIINGVNQTTTTAVSTNLISYLNPGYGGFQAVLWNQGSLENCTAWGSLVALSIEGSKTWGNGTIFDPNSTLQGPSNVPDYIASLHSRGYLGLWKDLSPSNRVYPFWGISVQQIPNNSGAKDAIKAAIDNNQAVVFSYNWHKNNHDGVLFREFWNTQGEDLVFNGINGPGDEEREGGHTMCIIGYDDNDWSFIVQNSWGTYNVINNTIINFQHRPNGTFKMPQYLNYTAWHYYQSLFPSLGGEYRFGFYKLIPSWITNDTQSPSIGNLSLDYVPIQNVLPPLPPVSYYDISVPIIDNHKVISASFTFAFPGYGSVNMTATLQNGVWKLNIPINSSTTPPMMATLTVIAYDTSGNIGTRDFQVYFSEGVPTSILP